MLVHLLFQGTPFLPVLFTSSHIADRSQLESRAEHDFRASPFVSLSGLQEPVAFIINA